MRIPRAAATCDSIGLPSGSGTHKRHKTHGTVGNSSGIDAIMATANMKGEIDIQEELDLDDEDDNMIIGQDDDSQNDVYEDINL